MYWEDLHTLLSILKAFLALLRWWTLQLLAGLLHSHELVKGWTRSAASLLSSFGWSSGQLAVRKCLVGFSFPACETKAGSSPKSRSSSIETRVYLMPVTDLLLCSSLPRQWSCRRASLTLYSFVWHQSSPQSWFRCCLLCMSSCCKAFRDVDNRLWYPIGPKDVPQTFPVHAVKAFSNSKKLM